TRAAYSSDASLYRVHPLVVEARALRGSMRWTWPAHGAGRCADGGARLSAPAPVGCAGCGERGC
ncbi:hypothetical protein, partial [Rhodococcus sp. BP-283]|uniref:hypothetical protein n=1 Tax=Rhodococcus sp. BP-283 TaxID=2739442 RepID=UPI001C9A88DE